MKEYFKLNELFPEADLIEDPKIREGVEEVWKLCWAQSSFENIQNVPVTPGFDYPHVVHNRSVVQMALSVAEIVEKFHNAEINRDHLIAAALLQDVSKLLEMEPSENDTKAVKSEIGEQFQHAFWGAHLSLSVGLPNEVVQAVLYHTFDGSKFPPNLICKILFYVDQIDMAALGGDRWKKLGIVYR